METYLASAPATPEAATDDGIEWLPRDTLPCPPPPSSLSPHSFDLTAEYWDDDDE
jgi:hypothetical protein